MSTEYTGVRAGIDPDTGGINWSLDGPTGAAGLLKYVEWTGEETSPNVGRARVNRASGQTGAGIDTGAPVSKDGLADSPTNRIDFFAEYASADPTLEDGALFERSYLVNGGQASWDFEMRRSYIFIVGAASPTIDSTIACKNDLGNGSGFATTFVAKWVEA